MQLKQNINSRKKNYLEKYKRLLKNEEFHRASSSRTTNIENIKTRIQIAAEFLYGVTYEW